MLCLYTLHIIHWVSFFHELCSFICPFYHYLSLCCNKSKSIDSLNAIYTFQCCLVISSILLSCRLIDLFVWSFSSSLWALVFVQWKRRWSIVWSSLPQMHFASSLKFNRWRYALVLPCPDRTAVSFGVRLILIPSLSRTDGKCCIVAAMAKAYLTTASEALCMLTGTTAIIMKLEELVQRYKAKERTGNCKIELDHRVEFKHWLHPADAVTIVEVESDEEATICAYRRKQARPRSWIRCSDFQGKWYSSKTTVQIR